MRVWDKEGDDWEVELIGVGDFCGGEGSKTDWCGPRTLWDDWAAMPFTKKGM